MYFISIQRVHQFSGFSAINTTQQHPGINKTDTCDLTRPPLLEQTCQLVEQDYDGLEVGESLVDCATDGVV